MKRWNERGARTLATAMALLAGLASQAAWGADALENTRKATEGFKAVHPPAGGVVSAEDRAANVAPYAELDGLFDFTQFSSDCLGPSAKSFSAAQRAEFQERLTDILRRKGYPNGGKAFRDGVLKLGAVAEREGRTVVPLSLAFPKEDLSLALEFVWSAGGKIVDMVIDGDSLSKDYRNQVGRIVSKSGASDLLKRLAKQQKDLPQVLP